MIIYLLLLERFDICHLFVCLKLDCYTKLDFMYHYIRTIFLSPQQHIAHCHQGRMVHLSCVRLGYINCNKKACALV